jgi:CDP-4-dehydro-6-deoxyglucose reductase
MAWNWFDATLIGVEDLTHNTRMFTLKIETEEPFVFEAGQFITLDLPIGVKRRDGWRSYSISNEPNNDNIIELCIVRLEGGAGTRYLFDEAKIGEVIKFKGPSGDFTLNNEKTKGKHVVCICTGTGIAPFRGMWRDFSGHGRQETGDGSQEAGIENLDEPKSMHLIFGTRTRKDILFEDEMKVLSSEIDWFTHDICLSREDADGYTNGYVHEVYIERYKDKTEDTVFYICGWSKMIDEAVLHLLTELKVDKSRIIYELYG